MDNNKGEHFLHSALRMVERFSWEFCKRILLAIPHRIWQTKWLKFGQVKYLLKSESFSGKHQATPVGATFYITYSHVFGKTFQKRRQDLKILKSGLWNIVKINKHITSLLVITDRIAEYQTLLKNGTIWKVICLVCVFTYRNKLKTVLPMQQWQVNSISISKSGKVYLICYHGYKTLFPFVWDLTAGMKLNCDTILWRKLTQNPTSSMPLVQRIFFFRHNKWGGCYYCPKVIFHKQTSMWFCWRYFGAIAVIENKHSFHQSCKCEKASWKMSRW